MTDRENTQATSNESDQTIRRKVHNTTLGRLGRIFCRIALFSFIVFCIAALGIGWWFQKYCPPIRMERANIETLSGWLVLRDFNQLSPENREELLKKYLEFYGPDVKTAESSKVFTGVQSLIRKYTQDRINRVKDWNNQRKPLPLLRNEYIIVPDITKSDRYVESSEIRPTELLRKNVTKYDSDSVIKPMTRTEGNFRVLTRQWFLLKMKQYDAVSPEEKLTFLEKTAEEMTWWQNYYNDFLIGLELDPAGELELLGEFALLTQCWYQNADIDELARLLWFKDLLVSVTVLKRMRVKNMGKVIPIQTTTSPFLSKMFHRPITKNADQMSTAQPREKELHEATNLF